MAGRTRAQKRGGAPHAHCGSRGFRNTDHYYKNVASQVVAFNQKLVQLRDTLQATYGPTLAIRMFDTNTLFNDLLNNPGKYGVTNTWQSCLNINSDSGSNYLYTWPARAECTNADAFVFWDTLHPTTHTHKLLADNATAFVRNNFPALTAPSP